eukprot:PITA_19809
MNGVEAKMDGIEAKMNGMEGNMNGMQVKMDGVEAKMDGMEAKMNGMDNKMEELKINLNKLLQEIVTNGERVVKDTHGYYHKFVKNYGRMPVSLNTLLKKDAFSWTPEATKAFEHLKEAMCQALVLAMLDFTKTFSVEYNAPGNGIGVVLMQDKRPIAFESHSIKGKYSHKDLYEKEMLAILHALKKW